MAEESSQSQYHWIAEVDQADNHIATYVRSTSENDRKIRFDVVLSEQKKSYLRCIFDAFLPSGYPASVTSDYLQYQIYDSLQAFSSSIAGMIASRAVLEGIGVGDSSASPTSALLLSVLQESMGRIATILFAHRLGTAIEPECKMYRLAADVFNDAAMIVDCLSPAFPKMWRVILFSFSSILRSLCGVAAGSSKASLSAHFATQGNLGELNAKDSSQETVISLLGMLAGSVVVSHISDKLTTWMALIFLLFIHLATNYMAVRSVCMRTFNRQRASLFFSQVIDSLLESGHDIMRDPDSAFEKVVSSSQIPSPRAISLKERIFEQDGALRWKGGRCLGYCKLGVSIKVIIERLGRTDPSTGSIRDIPALQFEELLHTYRESNYILWYDESCKTFLVAIKSHKESQIQVQLRAWIQALYFAKTGFAYPDESLMLALQRTRIVAEFITSALFSSSVIQDNGWDMSVSAMETHRGPRILMDAKD
ncbi:hypothetical protein K3495_g11282 [Podosphaera aphanis]|nr:hypothetical protein K3495_g11282 [Podosphaera aphanis]